MKYDIKKILQKVVCFGLSGLLLTSCNTTGVKSGNVKADREVASTRSIASIGMQVQQNCPVIQQLQNLVGRPDASNEVIRILFTEGSDGKAPIDNEFCIALARNYAEEICEQNSQDPICVALGLNRAVDAARLMSRITGLSEEELAQSGQEYGQWVREEGRAGCTSGCTSITR